jgi:hypothetical protein
VLQPTAASAKSAMIAAIARTVRVLVLVFLALIGGAFRLLLCVVCDYH